MPEGWHEACKKSRRWRTPVQKRDGDAEELSHADRRIEICEALAVVAGTGGGLPGSWLLAGSCSGARRVLGVLHPGRRDAALDCPQQPGRLSRHDHALGHQRDGVGPEHHDLLGPLGGRIRVRPRESRRPHGGTEVTLATTGSQRVFESANIPTTPRGTAQFYDGGDRLYVVGGVVTVTRATWIQARGWATRLPRGRSIPSSHSSRPTSSLRREPHLHRLRANFVLIQATEDNTTLQLDLDGNGTFDNFCTKTPIPAAHARQATVILNGGSRSCSTATPSPTRRHLSTSSDGHGHPGQRDPPGQVHRWQPSPDVSRPWSQRVPQGVLDDGLLRAARPADGRRGQDTDYYLYNPNSARSPSTGNRGRAAGTFTIPAGAPFPSGRSPAPSPSTRASTSGRPTSSGASESATRGAGLYEWGYSLLPSTMIYRSTFWAGLRTSIP